MHRHTLSYWSVHFQIYFVLYILLLRKSKFNLRIYIGTWIKIPQQFEAKIWITEKLNEQINCKDTWGSIPYKRLKSYIMDLIWILTLKKFYKIIREMWTLTDWILVDSEAFLILKNANPEEMHVSITCRWSDTMLRS